MLGQAYLETDPADRGGGKGEIQLRYQALAHQELDGALARYEAAEERLGERLFIFTAISCFAPLQL